MVGNKPIEVYLDQIDEKLGRIADALEKLLGEQSIGTEDVGAPIKRTSRQSDSKPSKDDGLKVVEEVQITEKEEVLQDLTQVFLVGETPKSWVVTKKGYQKFVPFSKIIEPKYEEMEVGNVYDITLDEDTEKWFHKKAWEKYKPYKGGKK